MLLFKILLITVIALVITLLSTPILMLFETRGVVSSDLMNEFKHSLLLSIYTSTISTILVLMLSIPIGYYVSRWIRNRLLLMSVIMIPASISPATIGLLLLLFFAKNPIGRLIDDLFLFVNDVKGIIVAQFVIGLPIGVSYFAALFSTIPRSYDESALTMGFKHVEILYKLFIPMIKQYIVTGYILVFTRVLGDFGASFIVGGGILGKTITLPIFMYIVNQIGDLALLSISIILYVSSILVILLITHHAERLWGFK